MKRLALILAIVSQCGSPPAQAADSRFPDWPCVQAKVPEISVVAVWSGPPIDDIGKAWDSDPRIKDLVSQIAPRRTSLDDAQKTIADFLTGEPAAKQEMGKLLFAGLYETLNRQRSEVMNGIERFSRKHRELADKIRSDVLELRKLQDGPTHDQSKIDQLSRQTEWETRIFEERRKTIGYVCEVPILIERRLFTLSRSIQQALE